MKLFKKSMSLFVAAVLCMMCFFNTSISANAAEPTTFYLKYVSANNEWRYQEGEWKADGFHRELYYMHEKIKDGDIVVIDSTVDLILELDVRLSNLTVVSGKAAVVHAKGYDNVYILSGAVAAVNGDVTNAYVYGNASVNFNNNVGTLNVLSETDNSLYANINVLGTVDHLIGAGKDHTIYENYSYEKGALKIINGENKSDVTKFTSTPPATTTTPSTPATPSTNNNKSDEYDEVPKTGDSLFSPLWIVVIAAVCMIGAYKTK
ncbi:MAG: hypothetical protein IJW63_07965 [Lachnospiraceae bacterium]|nr:hypothetical protein [Lachnospiraceae bacterium]